MSELSMPSLTLEPVEEVKTEAPAALQIKEEPVEQVKPVVIDDSMLSEAEKKVVNDFVSKIDITDSQQVMQYGSAAQKHIAAFNPISEEHWIKKKWFDKEKWHDVPMEIAVGGEDLPPELCKVKRVVMNASRMIANPRTGEYEEHAPDTVVIQSTYLNNFWVVGSPDGKYGYYDYQTIANFEHNRVNDPDYYQVYALGEWGHIRTGAEFFPSFNRGTVCGKFPYNPTSLRRASVEILS